MGSLLGIYFGLKNISIIQTKAEKIIKNVEFSREKIADGANAKVPEDVKLVALLNNELRAAGIEAEQAMLALPGGDLIIRYFEMGSLPREELASAVNYEVKKYIPFKTEELVSVFQARPEKKRKQNTVLFFSVKKELLEKYISVMEQAGLRILGIEYFGFSMLRLLDLAGIKKKGHFGFINMDLEEETSLMVLEGGFPLFSRDINLTAQVAPSGGLDASLAFDKLKNEIRISLDYYRRKLQAKKLDYIIAVADSSYKTDLEDWGNELGISIRPVDMAKYAPEQPQLSMGAVRAYSVSLAGKIKAKPALNLLSARERVIKQDRREAVFPVAVAIRPDYRAVLISAAIVFLSFIAGFIQRSTLDSQIKKMITDTQRLSPNLSSRSSGELQTLLLGYREKINTLDKLIKSQIYLTDKLNVIPGVLPAQAWLESLAFRQTEREAELIITGQVFFGDRDSEFEALNEIYSKLKAHKEFSNTFPNIEITSLDRRRIRNEEVTNFVISCRGKRDGI